MRPVLLGILLTGMLAATAAAQQSVTTIRGLVLDAAGRPLPGAEVVVGRRASMTGPDGRFVMDSLAPTRHFLVVRLIGYAPLRTELDLSDGVPREVEYRLEGAGVQLPMIVVEGTRSGIWGTVGDFDARPLAGARVEARGPRGGEVFTDSLGRFSFPRAGRGSHIIRVTQQGFIERRMLIELEGDGKEVAVTLLPGFTSHDRFGHQAYADLGSRLTFGLNRERIGPSELAKREGVAVCDIPRVRASLASQAVLIINGVTFIWADGDSQLINMLCAWRADELELVEFGPRVCDERTKTLAFLVGARCHGSGRSIARSLSGSRAIGSALGRDNPPYVVIWEKR